MLVVVSGCGGGGSTETFDDAAYPFTFEYDADKLSEGSVTDFDSLIGSNKPEDTTALALDDDNAIILQHFVLQDTVDDSNLDQVKEFFDDQISQVDSSASAGETGETAGFPSIEYASVPVTSPANGESRILLIFDGSEEFVINCQSTPDRGDELAGLCDQVHSSLEAR